LLLIFYLLISFIGYSFIIQNRSLKLQANSNSNFYTANQADIQKKENLDKEVQELNSDPEAHHEKQELIEIKKSNSELETTHKDDA